METIDRSIAATCRCGNALKRIFIAIGAKITGTNSSILHKITAGFLFILGSIFFLFATLPAIASNSCFTGTTKILENQKCEEFFNMSQTSLQASQPA